jgi:protein SEY1
LKKDLSNVWTGLSKPSGLESCEIDDYFDFQFTALPHKILMPDRFNEKVDTLRTRYLPPFRWKLTFRFVIPTDPDYVFHATYHKRIPVDGIPLYAKQCWDQIVSNKDLDLPSQQVLLAQYRCDEIAQIAMETFDKSIKPLEAVVRTDSIIPDLGEKIRSARGIVLTEFETQAQRYHKDTYNRKLEELKGTVDLRLHVLFRAQITGLHSICTKKFSEKVETELQSTDSEFGNTVISAKQYIMEFFDTEANGVIIEGTGWTYEHDRQLLVEEIEDLTSRLRRDQVMKMIDRLEKQVKVELEEPVALAFTKPNGEIWDGLMEEFERIKEGKVEVFKDNARLGLNATPQDVIQGVEILKVRIWTCLRDRLDGECEPTHLLLRLRELYVCFITFINFQFRG